MKKFYVIIISIILLVFSKAFINLNFISNLFAADVEKTKPASLVVQNDQEIISGPEEIKYVFKVREELKPKNLIGISDEQLDYHWKLYVGYVNQVNDLNKKLFELSKEGKSSSMEYSQLRRRYGFEYNGMVLHEYYFANLKGTEKDQDQKEEEQEQQENELVEGKLLKDLNKYFGSFGNWKQDFIDAGKSRGIGWVILYIDPTTGYLLNAFVEDHEVGNIAGYDPILVMDVWEHAYMIDYNENPKNDRSNYIDAFMKNINWPLVEKRYIAVKKGQIFKRF